MGFQISPGLGWLIALFVVGLLMMAYLKGVKARAARDSFRERTMPDIQAQMANLAQEIRKWEQSDSLSRSHHIRAAQIAYDVLLAEACKHAGLEAFANVNAVSEPTAAQRQWAEAHSLDVVPEAAPRPSASRSYTHSERMERELSLAELGFVW